MTILRDTLPRALSEHPRSPCYDDARFTSIKAVDRTAALAICATCTDRACRPILAELLADPTSRRLIEGTWDGRYYSQNTSGKDGAA